MKRLNLLPHDNTVTSGRRRYGDILFGTFWCQILYLLLLHNRSAYTSHSDGCLRQRVLESTCLNGQCFAWILKLHKVTALFFQNKSLCLRDRLWQNTISQSIWGFPLIVTFDLIGVLNNYCEYWLQMKWAFQETFIFSVLKITVLQVCQLCHQQPALFEIENYSHELQRGFPHSLAHVWIIPRVISFLHHSIQLQRDL